MASSAGDITEEDFNILWDDAIKASKYAATGYAILGDTAERSERYMGTSVRGDGGCGSIKGSAGCAAVSTPAVTAPNVSASFTHVSSLAVA